MTTLIKHYVRETTHKLNIKHWDGVLNDGFLKTEKQVREINDGIDSDLLWFTAADTIAGGANNFGTQTMKLIVDLKMLYGTLTRNLVNKYFAEYISQEMKFMCFVFDADEIGAELWNKHKKRWIGVSTKRAKYVQHIDSVSNINGDDTRDYWVSEKAVDIKLAKDVFFISESREEQLKRFGFNDAYDFYNWYEACLKKSTSIGLYTNEKVNSYLGKAMLKRDRHQVSLKAA